MALNLQERTEILETRTDSLEDLLGRFIATANRTMVRLETDTLNFRQEMDDFKDEMKDFKDEMKDFKDEMKDFKDEMKDEMKDFKGEMRRISENMGNAVTRMEADTKALKKELREETGKFENRMGTLVENMMAPSIPGIAKSYFGDSEFIFSGVRVWKKRAGRAEEKREFDVIAVSEKNFYVNETKSSPRPEYVRKFARMLPDLPDYFPEYQDKRVIPIFSSLYIPDNVVLHLTRSGIYAMGFKEDNMELLNFDQVEEQRSKE